MAEMRLQRYLARSGVASRRKSELLIAEGRVTVNGAPVTAMGVSVDPADDEVAVDGLAVTLPDERVTILLNKPAGVYTTMADQKGRPCVADLLPLADYPGLYHIGRLDRDTTGALLCSTDGALGQDLLHPARHVRKEYLAQVEGRPREDDLDRIRRGIEIRAGKARHACAPAEASVVSRLPRRLREQDSCLEPGLPGTSIVRIVLHEGVKHQVKLMLGAIGHPVVNLHRSVFGPIDLGLLKAGEWRLLSPEEVSSLYS